MKSLSCKNKLFMIFLVITGLCLPLIAATDDDFEYNYGSTGAVDRMVFYKLAESVSVKDFGATGDGVADDTTEIQNAVNYLQNSNLTGYVMFPPGKYKITAAIEVSGDGITLIGQGQTNRSAAYKASAIYNADNADNAIEITGDNSGVENLLIYNSGTATAGSAMSFSGCDGGFARSVNMVMCYQALDVYECQNMTFYDLDVADIAGDLGIRLYGTSDTPTKNITLRRIKTKMTDGDENTDCVWFKIADYTEDVEIANGRFIAGGTGTLITSASSTVGYPKNIRAFQLGTDHIDDESYRIETGSDMQFEGIWAGQGKSGDTIYIGSGVKGNLSFSTCYIRSSEKHGINVQGGDNISFTNCLVGQNGLGSSNTYDGLYIANGVDNISITGGKYGYLMNGGANSQRYGIHIDGTSHDTIVIQGVDVQGNITGGIKDDTGASVDKFLRYNIGEDNPVDDTLGYYGSGAVSNGRPLVQWIYGQKIKITHVAAKLSSGTCNIRVSYDGITRTSDISVSSTVRNQALSSPVEIDATSTPKRVEVYISSASSANDLQVGFGYTNMH